MNAAVETSTRLTSRSTVWIDAGTVHRSSGDPVWGQTFDRLEDDGGIGAQLWLNLDTGAMVLLAPSGGWKTGGRFHLFYAHSSDSTVVDISGALSRLVDGSGTYRAGDPSEWQSVKDRFALVLASTLMS